MHLQCQLLPEGLAESFGYLKVFLRRVLVAIGSVAALILWV